MDWGGIVWLVILLLVNGFFVAAEFAVISARRSQIEPRVDAGSRRARTALWAMEHATLMLATCQLGITVCSLVILTVSEPAIHHLLEIPLGSIGLSEGLVSGLAFAVTLIFVTFLHVVLGEMVPKNLAFSVPDRAVLVLATPLVFVATVLRPFVVALNAIANAVPRLFRVEPKGEVASVFTLDEVQTIAQHSTREGLLDDTIGTLSAAFEFTDKIVGDVALHLRDLDTLSMSPTPADLQRLVAQRGFSRYIVVDNEGEPTGYLHLKDVLDIPSDEYGRPVPRTRIRELITIPRDAELEYALTTMRRSGTHVARAVDARGTTHGVLFLEDVIEELIGEVNDATSDGRGMR